MAWVKSRAQAGGPEFETHFDLLQTPEIMGFWSQSQNLHEVPLN